MLGEDEPKCLINSWTNPCKTISYAVKGGHNLVCMKGAFQNLSDTIEIRTNTNLTHGREINIFCESCLLSDSRVILGNRVSKSVHVYFIKFKMKNSSIQLKNINVTFKDSILEQVAIQDSEVSPNQIYLERSSFSCSDTKICGLFLQNSSFVKCVIEHSILEGFKLNLDVYALLLIMNYTTLIGPEIQMKVKSPPYLRIPSLIQFHNVTVNINHIHLEGKRFTERSTSNTEIVLFLTNPYLLISRCTFYHAHLEIVANRHEFDHAYFWTEITDSKFINSRHEGNGGALTVISEVQNSKFFILSCFFRNNIAIKVSTVLKGYGGAIAIKANSLEAEIRNCVFLNNKAVDAGLDIYTSTGVRLFLIDCTFDYSVDPNNPIQDSLVFIAGISTKFGGDVEVTNPKPESYIGKISLFYIAQVEDIHMNIMCPIWYRHSVQYNFISTDSNRATDLIYDCNPCSDNHYFPSNVNMILSYSASENTSVISFQNTGQTSKICIKCPYGAICTGNNVMPRPNYWGYWYQGKLQFIQCPAGYCCSGGDSSICNVYDYCAGNRTSTLCGACQEGLSVSILTGACTPDTQCKGDQWFWLFALLSAMAYALWYTLKDDLIAVLFVTPTYVKHFCSDSKPKLNMIEHKKPQSLSKISSTTTLSGQMTDKTDIKEQNSSAITENSGEDIDKGYFGIVTYYVQMATVIRIHIEFSDIDKSDSFTDKITDIVGRFLNIELTKMSFDICPVVGLTTLGKHLYSVGFLVAIYVSWSVAFIIIYTLTILLQRKARFHSVVKNLQSFRMKLVKGMVEIIKYTYAGFCGLIFVSLVCMPIGEHYVWWYDGTNVCLENWQVLFVIFAIFYAFPFPFALAFGLKLLKQNKISATRFTCCCLCPLIALCFLHVPRCKKPVGKVPGLAPLPEASETIISVLQGPYREDDQNMTLYWEAMVSIRRLLITGMTLIGFASIRMIIISVLCLVFLVQHIFMMPFHVKTSNYIEALSLLLLSITAMINLLKASLTDSGVVPSGPTAPFFKSLELCEKLFVFLIIAHIFVTELKSRKRKVNNAK